VWEGLGQDGVRRGFAVVAEGPGFQDTIRLLYGLDTARRVITGVAILESRETPGLGDRILHDEAFHRSFEALAVEPSIEVVMGTPTAPNQIDGITGATISSRAVATILDGSARDVLAQLVAAERPSEGSP
jgi:electron transport complex protein RnfG